MGNIIKLTEISKAYTDRLSELLVEGYVMNASTMSGTQGEYGRIDLTKDNGKTVRRLYIDRGSKYGEDWKDHADYLCIIEEEFNRNSSTSIGTLWNGKGNIINKKEYYLIDRKHNVYELHPSTSYVDNLDAIKTANRKHYDRCDSRYTNSTRSFKPTEKVLEVVRKYKGFKGVKLSDIEKVEICHRHNNEVYYRVIVNNRKCNLCIEKGSYKYHDR